MATLQPTDRQLEVLRFIANEIESRGYPPTIREIGEALDIASTNGVNNHLKALEKKGYLQRDPVKSRALIPTAAGREALGGPAEREARVISLVGRRKIRGAGRMVEIPILGRVAAGQPILAQEQVEDTVQVDSFFLGTSKKVYGLRVQGDSMIGDGILSGDYIFVKKQLHADDGGDRGRPHRRRGDGEAHLLRGGPGAFPAVQPAHGAHLRPPRGLPDHHDPRRRRGRVPEDAVTAAGAAHRARSPVRPASDVTRMCRKRVCGSRIFVTILPMRGRDGGLRLVSTMTYLRS